MNKDIYILGIGRNAVVFMDLVEACGYKIKGLYHYSADRIGEYDHGYPIIGCFDDLWAMNSLEGMNFALSQGNNTIRKDIFYKIKAKGGCLPTLISPRADVSRHAVLGEGTIVHTHSVIHPDVVIGDNTIISYSSNISHGTTIGKHCYVAFGALVGACIDIYDEVFIGIGANLISDKVSSVGFHSFIGAGSLVTKAVPEQVVLAGSPAKIIKRLD